ncbi:glycoside hydrolase family 2 TIM barrel-domain containing protein [Gelidibacter pelagius]|uniref:Glycoside hydrolase family 2 n=1 Tax=Gelidibacter pelagius TaxID=2819985 RepID=A0ABS3SR18_9FLAO|nr:glycoside hydrolase family 2 TIM barrel-domain containing protein [Gelidibacter pelagius]MBO3097776.1 glycoside hydrolase family 2 [Gelidibacter pelagius]
MKPHKTYHIRNLLILFCVAFSYQLTAQKTIINSGWQFTLDTTKTNWQTVNIPHTWNKDDAFDDESGYFRGSGFYQKHVYVPSEKEDLVHYLKFKGVNQETNVYVNGSFAGNHKGGYTAFNFNITEFIKFGSYNLIEVKVDNSLNLNIPPLDIDFTIYGGIYRDVEWIALPKQHLTLNDFASEGFYVDYPNVSKEKASVEVSVLLDNFDVKSATNQLEVSISDADGKIIRMETKKIKINANSSENLNILFSDIHNPKLWSPEHPNLYHLQILLKDKHGTILDEKSSNIAFRWVSVDPNKGLFLNGESYKIIGVNRHQDYNGYGSAVPMQLQEKDIHLIKNMGANVIRFAHYPQAQELYKLCDELGLLVWSEIPVVNKVTNTPEFFETSMTMQEEHLKQYYNFPSVVMFGYMNEIFLRLVFDRKSTDLEKEDAKVYSYELAKQLEDFTRKMAPNRLTVMALHFNEVYNDTKIADLSMLIGWNLYFGWYNDTIPDLGIFLDDQHKRFPNRSIMVSEYGPGADVNISSTTPKKYDYTQEYQLILHKSYYDQVMARDFVVGMTAWNFADFGSEFRGETIPHLNQKGLVQYNREPKDVYFWYKAVLNTKEPLLHIALNPEHPLNLINEDKRTVSIFSNEKKAEVYLNGELIDAVTFSDGLATADIPFINGENELKVVANSQEEIKTLQVFKSDNLKTAHFKRFGINLGSHFSFYDQENNVTFVPDRQYSENLYGHFDGTPYNITKDKNQGIPNNIKNTEKEGVFQTMLEGCTGYKVDVPDGQYQITLFFVEPQIKSNIEMVFNLTAEKELANSDTKKQRKFDVFLNDILVESRFDLANTFPDKYGVTLTSMVNIRNNEGLSINLKPIEGKTVLSGVLIEKKD